MSAKSELVAEIRTRKTGNGEEQAKTGLAGLNQKFTDLTGVSLGAAGAVAALGAGLKFAVDNAAEAEVVQAQLNAVIKSTGGAAGLTADEIDALAGSLSDLSGVEDETIKRAAAVMLTFTQIGEQVFPDATEAALNMSQALGQDLQSSVIQVGKALNDPIQGMTALSRVGVSFTEQQKEQIKALQESGDLMGAQRVILAELNKEFGGAAAAMGSTYTGAINKFQNALGNLGEEIGSELLPSLIPAIEGLTEFVKFVGQSTDAVNKQVEAVAGQAISYEDYRKKLEEVAAANGMVIDTYGNLTTWNGRVVEANVLLSESEWEKAKATQEWLTKMDYAGSAAAIMASQVTAAGEAVDAAREPVERLAPQFQALADSARASAQNAAYMADVSNQLATAQGNLQAAQENWREGVGGDMGRLLEEAGLKGTEYHDALTIIDDVTGSSLLPAQQLKEAEQALIDEFLRTGDLESFRKGLEEMTETFEPLDTKIREAQGAVDELIAHLAQLNGTQISIGVSVTGGGSGGGGGGGTSGSGGTPSPGSGSNPIYSGPPQAVPTLIVNNYGPAPDVVSDYQVLQSLARD